MKFKDTLFVIAMDLKEMFDLFMVTPEFFAMVIVPCIFG